MFFHPATGFANDLAGFASWWSAVRVGKVGGPWANSRTSRRW